MKYFAHSHPDRKTPPPHGWQWLREHLETVAQLAAERAEQAVPGRTAVIEGARAAGWWHDLGKYRLEFQLMMLGAHPANEQTWHKQAGAALAKDRKRDDIAFAIAGHHGGMPDKTDLKQALGSPSGAGLLPTIWPTAQQDCPPLASVVAPGLEERDKTAFELLTRFLFSCLVDADWDDTGDHERKVKGWPKPADPEPLAPSERLRAVLSYIEQRAAACRDDRVRAIRSRILAAALKAAPLPAGLFEMTVPTGGGKTLSGFAFALAHAAQHGLRRVIYVAPYLSILEQNARELRRALGVSDDSPVVFEHHSLAEPPGGPSNEAESDRATRRAENWDAPIIATSNVQFFESLFANQPGRCRKLHNIARSVILLDECQTLPPGLVAPTCSMLGQLASVAGCSIVLCTATQPAWKQSSVLQGGLENVRPIVPVELDLFRWLERVKVTWPKRGELLEWEDVARVMRSDNKSAALCIVNTRPAARKLFELLRQRGAEGLFHLSTTMCPKHRLEVIDTVKKRLDDEQPCWLVSTQLIECGCDVDFPFVMRELSPLEAVVQSAGRCNREGLLNAADGTPGGRVVVFRSPNGIPKFDLWYQLGTAKLDQDFLLAGHEPDIGRPEDIAKYYTSLYHLGNLDEHGVEAMRKHLQFATIASKYELIDDVTTPVVVTTWEPHRAEVERLLRDLLAHPTRERFRRLAPFQVNLRNYEIAKAGGSLRDHPTGLKLWDGGYDEFLGLSPDNSEVVLLV